MVNLFIGEHQHSLDSKSRMIVPAKFRKDLGQTFIITKGLDKCLSIYPAAEWAAINAKLSGLPLADKGARRFLRFMLGSAHECESDDAGRVIIPPTLRDYASITKDIVSVGMGGRIELWSRLNWDSYNFDSESAIDDELAERMSTLGI